VSLGLWGKTKRLGRNEKKDKGGTLSTSEIQESQTCFEECAFLLQEEKSKKEEMPECKGVREKWKIEDVKIDVSGEMHSKREIKKKTREHQSSAAAIGRDHMKFLLP